MATKKFQDQTQEPPAENPEAAVMRGGPGIEENPPEETPPAAPTVREVTINGRKFQVDPEMAEAIAQRDRDFDRKLNENSNELGRLRKLAQDAIQPTAAPQAKPYSQLLFEDPDGAVQRIQREVEQRIEGKYIQEKKLEQFWNKFYRSNKDLDRDDDDFIVKAVLNENLNSLANMPEDEAASRLADLSRRQILKYSGKNKDQTDEEPISRARVESASRPSARPAQPREQGPTTLTDLIKQRQRQRAGVKSA